MTCQIPESKNKSVLIFSRLSSDEGIKGDLTQQEPEAALGGGAGLWKLYEQGSEGECLRLQGVFAQQDR